MLVEMMEKKRMKKAAINVLLNIGIVVLILGGMWGVKWLIKTHNENRDERLQREADGVSNPRMTESEYLALQLSEETNETENQIRFEDSLEKTYNEANQEEGDNNSSFTRFVPDKNERIEGEYDGFYELGDSIDLHLFATEGSTRITVLECRVITKDEEGLDWKKFQGVDGQPVWAITYADGTRQQYVYPQFVQEDGHFLEGISLLLVKVRVENLDARADNHATQSFGGDYNFDAKALLQMRSSKWTQASYASPWYRIKQEAAYFSEMNGVFEDSEAEHAWIFTLGPGEVTEFVLGFYLSDRYERGEEELSEIRFEVADHINFHVYTYLINPHLE